MTKKTITKNLLFVILLGCVAGLYAACAQVFPGQEPTQNKTVENGGFASPEVLARIDSPEIRESSGLVASRCQKDVFWTHNDSGDDALIYAIDLRGKKLGTWKLVGVKNYDWEDIATRKLPDGKCELFIGDIGNNTRERDEFAVYTVSEPEISASAKESTRRKPIMLDNVRTIRISYPDLRRDSESLLVHPTSGDIYVLSKRISGSAGVYKLSSGYSFERLNKLVFVGDLSVPAIPNGLLTGGDISPDGRHVIICDYFNAYELTLPKDAAGFDDIWKQEPQTVTLGPREQGEAITYSADGTAIFATSERKNSPLIKVARRAP